MHQKYKKNKFVILLDTIIAEDRTYLLFENCKRRKARRRHLATRSNKTALYDRETPDRILAPDWSKPSRSHAISWRKRERSRVTSSIESFPLRTSSEQDVPRRAFSTSENTPVRKEHSRVKILPNDPSLSRIFFRASSSSSFETPCRSVRPRSPTESGSRRPCPLVRLSESIPAVTSNKPTCRAVRPPAL